MLMIIFMRGLIKMSKEIETELRLTTILERDMKENLNLTIDNNVIILKVNPNKIFSSLLNREIIISFIHRELEDLLNKHLETMSQKENER